MHALVAHLGSSSDTEEERNEVKGRGVGKRVLGRRAQVIISNRPPFQGWWWAFGKAGPIGCPIFIRFGPVHFRSEEEGLDLSILCREGCIGI